MNDSLRPVRPLSPLAPYIGGKKQLSSLIIERIEAIPHDTYAEAFLGMGGVFLRRRRAPKVEVVNDWSRDVATFFRVLQHHYVAFLDFMRFQLTVRTEFDRLVAMDPETLTDIQRAARFLYLQRLAFGGKVTGRNFGVDAGAPGRFNILKLGPLLEALHERLAGVVVERLSCSDFVGRYDTSSTLFYLDPPYWDSEDDYGAGMFPKGEFGRLARQLAGIKGRFILSLNDVEAVRNIFEGFHFEEVELVYGIQGGQAPAREVLISNVDLAAVGRLL
jgi:DNA adenine methylase